MHRDEQIALDSITAIGHPVPDLAAFGVPTDRLTELAAVTRAAVDYPAFQADRLVDDGDLLDVPGRELHVIHAPGHTTGSICVRETDAKLLFTGDHVLPSVHPGLGLGGASESSPIADYLQSLAKIAAFDDHEVCPGHGYRFTGLAQRAERIAAHHRHRTDEVSLVLLNRPNATVWEIASRLSWTGGWANLHGYYVYTALVQTAMHVEYLNTR
jgi:glyoxylase-like metal-dependent hydrolase (beta-lactamase superfamily II)